MKFLTNVREGQNIVPLKFMYNDPMYGDDCLSVVYKDVDTGKKYIENIIKPCYELYIVKPERRNDKDVSGRYIHDVIKIEDCDKFIVRYKYRKRFAADKLGINPEDVSISPFVANYDIDIENWYHIQFIKEYPYNKFVPISTGYVDIETDITHATVSGASGENPIVCITYISEKNHVVYNLTLNDPIYKGNDKFANNISTFIDDCKKSFELYDSYGGKWEYECVSYTNEGTMLMHFWKLVKMIDDDFLVAWNAPFDIISLIERVMFLGMDPFDVICDSRYAFNKLDVKEDTQIKVTKRRHTFDITIAPVVGCLMTMFANVNSASSVIPSFKLNVIADMILADKKVEYLSKYKNIMDFLYSDFYEFNRYNIKDVFLMVGINHEAHVIEDVFSRTYSYRIQFPAVFSSNNMLQSVLMMEYFEMGYVVGINRNKYNVASEFDTEYMFDEDSTDDENEETVELITESQNVYDDEGNKKKFAGAVVMNPLRQCSTGYMINGAESVHVHVWCIDMDITSEYPTAMCLMNMSNETFVGKLILSNDDDIELPIYDAYEFFGDEKETYKCNKVAVIMETISQRDFISAGNIAFGLPNPLEVEKLLEQYL